MVKIKKKVSSDFNNYCLIKYLKLLQPSWTKVFAYKMIRTKNVKINSKSTTINYRLQEGDLVEIFGSEKVKIKDLNLSKLKTLKVIYEDENALIANKEVKISVQSDEKSAFNNMNNRLLQHLNWDAGSNKWKPVFIHRLDYNTTGLLIAAKNYQSWQNLNKAQKEQQIIKKYKALVNGIVSFKERIIKLWLLKRDKKVEVVAPNTKGAKEAITKVKLIKHYFAHNSSLLELELVTGKTHQIRAHLASLNYPIRGDQKYGVEKNKKDFPYPALCAYKLKFLESIEIETLKNKEFEIRDIWFEKLL
ncbi:pseudouridylate synthase [Candidatus Mycoplasma haematobovis]|uniref:RNA pseudouridylate synthase n=1 Tax=Candidatus Mycoplasma haematobovis TaxID=432608 RepID=A0A1A9QEN9_9MOLU|nr:pseudouridylate synthase [Candidatus Mycoplasma haematobovis]